MSGGKNKDFWRVLRPSAWPHPPRWMSFSTLIELEACPRRWALIAAEYSSAWKFRGYPSTPHLTALEGTVVHLSLEKITGALVRRGCPSLIDESAILTLRELGGYTTIIKSSLEQALLSYRENPRAAPVLDGIRQLLTSRVPELRIKVQKLLSRIRPNPGIARSEESVIHREGEGRQALQHGSHTEVHLQAPELGWRGAVDVLTLSTTQCEIRHFKTGTPKEEHKVQVWIYALLWARDGDLNPYGRLADKLVLSYDDKDIEVPAPTASTLRSLEDELKERTAAALADLKVAPPPARTGLENCGYCVVRHLCEEYWDWLIQQGSGNESEKGRYADIQIKLSSKHGPKSWDGMVENGPAMAAGKPILLRTDNVGLDLHPDQQVRMLNVYVSTVCAEDYVEHGSTLTVATMGSRSEMFLLSM